MQRRIEKKADLSDTPNPDLCRNTIEYINNHKNRNTAEIRLHFINIKSHKYAYKHDGNTIAKVLVANLYEDMSQLHTSELYYNEARGPIYYGEKMENSKCPKT